ncbi:bifunctional N-acetylglucosamine-1-phosphate uridyltransferase/glucosamine-1-phosphate acetyltransferase [Methylophilales bacterium MBRSG12]|uniref:Bifunctional protein GlmU n=1 Tax=Methylophilales bacterium MBRS-H7 TaxID=1623450 RepID=A0A0H4IXV0_9PROT|nr:bifunctional N-acetylglucosamine-1-phosphate uridyltransferase/glucosamine-1-phosphate acetyltransferase [Methylophilales bacterium MBRSF5]AKO65791.1 bifunctional N-acetylglucosamine-1-phosphate uridyltransferase/glucosamine-1-phosphate acetyltransferase [Methylophilales bacterium MBRS-H7]AKO67110.1 bifunctional N-acetylglucosamine-1-phosphate uridyltransferase/glucosamine-1-phosphate acetyltransferase [Methylophilales bacterium MBRSG12]
MNLDIVILAAGKGTRMKSSKPKVMQEFVGQPFLQRVINTAKELDPNKIIPIVGYKADEIKNYFSNQQLDFVIQKDQLGTGHAVMQAINEITSQLTLILYGDVPLINHKLLIRLIDASKKTGIGLVTFDKTNPTDFGRIIRDDNKQKIIKIVEEKDCDFEQKKINEINTGIMCVQSDHLKKWLAQLDNNNAQKEYYLTDIIEFANKDKIEVTGIKAETETSIQGINSIEELILLERMYMQEKAEQLINQGVKIIDPNRIDIRGTLTCEENVTIDVGCIFEGDVLIKKNSKIGPYNIIKASQIGENTNLNAFNHIDDALIGDNCNIGPYSRIRPATTLKNNINIGNFVEIKKSSIDDHSKINHLSYVGDTKIGKEVNIGAGTITCNYDGANKHQTIIEDHVFIGSDTQLIAPVVIKKGATIGAGSTITEDAPENKLTISRVEQKSIDDWIRPKKK